LAKRIILEVAGLTKAFGGLRAVDGLGFSMEDNEILGIIGPNGAGKTTLINLITGFLKPDTGKITFKGEDITFSSAEKRARLGIARTFQLVKPFGNMTTLDNVAAGRLYGSEPANNLKQARADAEEVLHFVGLGGKGNVMACNLTFADRRKLELARALATKPDLLFLDEVLAGLNPVEVETAMATVKEIKDQGIAIALIEHIIKAVVALSTRIVVMDTGKRLAEGIPQEILNNPSVIETYLGKEA
jgi:branched-chain amino acid transport system ATP-binding protein